MPARRALAASCLITFVCLGLDQTIEALSSTTGNAQASTSPAVTPADALPRLRDARLPDYPRGAIELVTTLTVQFNIDTKGRVEAAQSLDEDHGLAALVRNGTISAKDAEGFRKSAVDALEKWRYDPPITSATAFVRFEFYPRTTAQAVWHAALPPPSILAGRLSVGAGTATTAVRIGGRVAVPNRVVHVDPEYPNIARVARIPSAVVLELVVGEAGDVVNAQIIRSSALFDDAALQAARQWKYEPLQINGQPTAFVVAVAITYDPDSRAAQRGFGVVVDPSAAR